MLTKMDVIQFSLGLYSFLFVIRGCVNSLVIDVRPNTGIWDTSDRTCSKRCKYGYDTDVEGNSMCKCLDPCAHIFCPFEGTRCVVRKSVKSCRNSHCKYEANCKSVSDFRRKKLQKLENLKMKKNKYKNEVFYGLQQDSAVITDMCSKQPSIDSIYRCAYRQPGYYYDGLKGDCVRFRGCHQPGDFFSRRKDCNRSCIKNRQGKQEPRYNMCKLPPNDNSLCTKVRRLWYYDKNKDRCIKTKGCNFTGNSFRWKSQCKKVCKHKKFRTQQRKRFIS